MWPRCRLCAAPAPAGSQLYAGAPARRPLASLVNAYLPLKVVDNGKFPRTICPGCNIQLEATAQFLELVIKGQNKLRELLKNPEEVAIGSDPSVNINDSENFVQVSENGSIYPVDHSISLRMEGIDKPRKKRGRPKKIPKIIEPIVLEFAAEQNNATVESTTVQGKRRRTQPKRYTEVVQGKELEKILRDEGVTDGESDVENVDNENMQILSLENSQNINNDEIIGHMETLDGTSLGQLVVVNKHKGRGKRKSRSRVFVQTCNVCGLEFNAMNRYMAHMAVHTQTQIIGQDSVTTDFLEKNVEEIHDVAKDFADFAENQYFDTGPSMPDISSDIITSIEDNEKLNVTPILDSITNEIFQETNPCIDPASHIINMEIETPNVLQTEDAKIVETESIDKDMSSKIKTLNAFKFQCAECGKIFNSKQTCDVHLRVQHLGERPHRCEYCNYSFAYKVGLQRHLLMHFPKGEKGFACDICGKILNHPSSVLYHKETMHNNGRRFICNKCGRSFKHRQLLRKHQVVHSDSRPFVCKVCNASFKTKTSLINHLQIHTGIKKFSCEICSQQFSNKSGLTLHLRWHFGQKPFKCTVCNKSFSQNGNLTEHMRIHTGEKPFVCKLCHRRFTASSQLHKHTERHKNERPWQCQECGKRFVNKDVWKYHVRRHRGEKPFVCPICSKRFTDRWSLRKHSRFHSGEKPFVCNVCNRSFADSSNLGKHKKTHRENTITTEPKLTPEMVSISDTFGSVLENHVLCVSYNPGEGSEEHPTFHIVNEDEINNLNNCAFYETETDLLVNDNNTVIDDSVSVSEVQTSNAVFDQFVDEDGNPIQFTLQDSGQFEVRSSDGKLLEIEDNGEINMSRELEEVTLTSEELCESSKETMPPSQTVKFLTSLDENTLSQYFTIV